MVFRVFRQNVTVDLLNKYYFSGFFYVEPECLIDDLSMEMNFPKQILIETDRILNTFAFIKMATGNGTLGIERKKTGFMHLEC